MVCVFIYIYIYKLGANKIFKKMINYFIFTKIRAFQSFLYMLNDHTKNFFIQKYKIKNNKHNLNYNYLV